MNDSSLQQHQAELDGQVDRALRALGGVKPSPHMNDRLLTALQARSDGPKQPHAVVGKGWSATWFIGLSAAVLAVLTLGVGVSLRRPAVHPAVTVGFRPGAAPLPDSGHAVARTGAEQNAPQKVATKRTQIAGHRIRLSVVKAASARVVAPGGAAPTGLENLDNAAELDFHTPSFPAPPLPPTAQERMVRRMLRQGERVQLTKLQDARDPAIAAIEKAELHAFFEPRSAPEQDAADAEAPARSHSPEADKVK